MENKLNQNVKGLDLSSANWRKTDGFITYALNANVDTNDGDALILSNEKSNQICYNFEINKPGFKILKSLYIQEQQRLIVFLAHQDGRSEIGEIKNFNADCESLTTTEEDCGCSKGVETKNEITTVYPNDGHMDSCCTYEAILTDNCLGNCEDSNSYDINNCCLKFSIDYPIQAIYRIHDCKTYVYFVSKAFNPKRIVLEEPLGKDKCRNEITCIKEGCFNLDFFPKYCHPELYPISVSSGGRLKSGIYSFSIAYTNEDSLEITDYSDFTNPIPIVERKITEQLEYETSKSINVRIEHKDTEFSYFNLIVAENINEVTSYYLVGTYEVSELGVNMISYTGDYKSNLSEFLPHVRTPYYNKAEIITSQNDTLFLGNLEAEPKYNFQKIANEIELEWETVEMTVNGRFDYSNPEMAYFFRTYQRDEVYAFGIKFRLKTGKYTDVFHIPGREFNSNDIDGLLADDKDVFKLEEDCIINETLIPKWKVYNTAFGVEDASYGDPEDYSEKQYSCEIIPHKKGKFAYWESSEKYPCNEEVWGRLSEKNIRHHRFPDSIISHIHDGKDSNLGFNHESKIYPIGVRINKLSVDRILQLKNNLTGEYLHSVYDPITKTNVPLKDLICGFELVRGNRVNNKSVIAKGLVYDVGKYEHVVDNDINNGINKSYYYPNYPFNDLRADFFLANNPDWYDEGNKTDNPVFTEFKQDGFNHMLVSGVRTQTRFTFHSPDTSFQNPKIGNELKLETVEYGKILSHFVQVEDHPKNKYLDNYTYYLSGLLASVASFSIESSTTIAPVNGGLTDNSTIDLSKTIETYVIIQDLIKSLVPYINYAWQYNGVGNYNNFTTIPNSGNKRRVLELSAYLDSKISEVGDDSPIHNRLRESSVYLKAFNSFKHYSNTFVFEYHDNSRYNIGDYDLNTIHRKRPDSIYSDSQTRACYASLKRNFSNQWGQITDVKYVSTGYVVDIYPTTSLKEYQMEFKHYPAFGGDTFINKFSLKRKHSFFTQNLVNNASNSLDFPFDYWLSPNLAYPAFYIGNSPEQASLTDADTLIALGAIITATAAIVVGSTTIVSKANMIVAAASIASVSLGLSGIYSTLKPKINLDNVQSSDDFTFLTGAFYTGCYGISSFFVESDINVDFRHGRNDREENFYPNVSGEIPDEWLQEKNVSIRYDNFYHYNPTFSAQNNTINLHYGIKNPDSDCRVIIPNGVIQSEKLNNRAYDDSWKSFKRNSFFEFPKQDGKLIALNPGQNQTLYARFENNLKIYGTKLELKSNFPLQYEIGLGTIFQQDPLDLIKTDFGYTGSQHKSSVMTKDGLFWVDAKRGNVFLMGSQGLQVLSSSSTSFNWFKEHLPFNIFKTVPNADIDNPAKGIGIVLGYDQRHDRMFITKLDYSVKSGVNVSFNSEDNKFYVGSAEAAFDNEDVFENKSWTIAYSFHEDIRNFISFYSFTPNEYISFTETFQTIKTNSLGSTTWNHGLNSLSYQTYYNVFKPYVLEYCVSSIPKQSVVNNVSFFCEVREYVDDYHFYSVGSNNNDNKICFTKAIVYNHEQTSGMINLIPQEYGNTRQRISYPKITNRGIETLLSHKNHLFLFNGFWDNAVQNSRQPLWTNDWSLIRTHYPIDKIINPKAVTYTNLQRNRPRIKSEFCKIRLIQDQYSRYKFLNHLQSTIIS